MDDGKPTDDRPVDPERSPGAAAYADDAGPPAGRAADDDVETRTGTADAAATPDDDTVDAPVELPITDVLDLHSFRPRDVPDVVRDYLDAAWDAGLRELRIIHGRGRGVQRRTVRTLLDRDPRVVAFGDAPLEAGGWGATWLEMRR